MEYEHVSVLDHGFVQLVEHWGSDEAIICAARMSTGKGFLGWGPLSKCAKCGGVRSDVQGELCPSCDHHTFQSGQPGDEKLLRFLYENKHMTPFEMGGLTFEVKAPIFVFREWHRHRVPFSYNEMSARYTPLPDENYIPTVERLMINSKTNKQAGTAKGAKELTEEAAQLWLRMLQHNYNQSEATYQWALEKGVSKELARILLPVGRYSRMRVSANLRGWLAFLTLRMAPNAQWEIRQFANAVATLVEEKFPRTWSLFAETQNEAFR